MFFVFWNDAIKLSVCCSVSPLRTLKPPIHISPKCQNFPAKKNAQNSLSLSSPSSFLETFLPGKIHIYPGLQKYPKHSQTVIMFPLKPPIHTSPKYENALTIIKSPFFPIHCKHILLTVNIQRLANIHQNEKTGVELRNRASNSPYSQVNGRD